MSRPLVSIIVPVYKVPEKYLRQCIESCINQTLHNIEIIVVDDGSPDNCPKICDEYAEKDSRIRIIHKENGGLVSARNAGFEAVQGEWHMYLDGDDWIERITCESIINSVSKHNNIDIAFWKYVQELDGKQITGKCEWPCKEEEQIYNGTECIELARHTLIYKSGIATAYCKLINTQYAKEHGIYHDKRLRQGCEGIEFSLRAFYNAGKALFLNQHFNHYIYNPDSISKAINEKNTEYLTDCFNVIYEDIQQFDRKDDFTEALYQRVTYMLIAIAMGTYFHPKNSDSLWTKSKKFNNVIHSCRLYKDSIDKCDTTALDKSRKIALLCIRYKAYAFLALIANVKIFLLKRGKYNY